LYLYSAPAPAGSPKKIWIIIGSLATLTLLCAGAGVATYMVLGKNQATTSTDGSKIKNNYDLFINRFSIGLSNTGSSSNASNSTTGSSSSNVNTNKNDSKISLFILVDHIKYNYYQCNY
jgi:hypothetical protein